MTVARRTLMVIGILLALAVIVFAVLGVAGMVEFLEGQETVRDVAK